MIASLNEQKGDVVSYQSKLPLKWVNTDAHGLGVTHLVVN